MVKDLNEGRSRVFSVNSEDLNEMLANGFTASVAPFTVSECDLIILCLPTPLDQHQQPDLSYITDTLQNIGQFLRKGQVLSLESTTWPGTTREILAPYLHNLGFTLGDDFYLIYSPEREDPGNISYDVRNIPKIIGGLTENCLAKGAEIYSKFIDTLVPVSSPEIAEMAKLTENIHRSVNIGLVNELKMVCHSMNIDVFDVIDAAATKPFGFVPYYPGPGVGGHCIPIDPYYLAWRAKAFGVRSKFIELAGEINDSMPGFVVNRLQEALNEQHKTLKNSKILICGITYKKDVNDYRESPAIEIIHHLINWGAEVFFSDPYFEKFPPNRRRNLMIPSVNIDAISLESFDAVVIATDHSSFNYDTIIEKSLLVVDTRGIYREKHPNLIVS